MVIFLGVLQKIITETLLWVVQLAFSYQRFMKRSDLEGPAYAAFLLIQSLQDEFH